MKLSVGTMFRNFLIIGVLLDIFKLPGLPFLSLWSVLSIFLFFLILTQTNKINSNPRKIFFLTFLFCLALYLGSTLELSEVVKVLFYFFSIFCISSLMYRYLFLILRKIKFHFYALGILVISIIELISFPEFLIIRKMVSFDQLYPFYNYSAYLIVSGEGAITDSFIAKYLGFNFLRLVGFNYEPSFYAYGFTFFSTLYIISKEKKYINILKILIFGIILTLLSQSSSVLLATICLVCIQYFTVFLRNKAFLISFILSTTFLIMCLVTYYIVVSGELFNQRLGFWQQNLSTGNIDIYSRNMFFESIYSWNFINGPLDIFCMSLISGLVIFRRPILFAPICLMWFSGFPLYIFSFQCLLALTIIILFCRPLEPFIQSNSVKSHPLF